jgi:hypothetical protein
MNSAQPPISLSPSLESSSIAGEIQANAHTGTLPPELLNLVSGGDTILCW